MHFSSVYEFCAFGYTKHLSNSAKSLWRISVSEIWGSEVRVASPDLFRKSVFRGESVSSGGRRSRGNRWYTMRCSWDESERKRERKGDTNDLFLLKSERERERRRVWLPPFISRESRSLSVQWPLRKWGKKTYSFFSHRPITPGQQIYVISGEFVIGFSCSKKRTCFQHFLVRTSSLEIHLCVYRCLYTSVCLCYIYCICT